MTKRSSLQSVHPFAKGAVLADVAGKVPEVEGLPGKSDGTVKLRCDGVSQGQLYRKAMDVLESEGYIDGWDGLGTNIAEEVEVTDDGYDTLKSWIEQDLLEWEPAR